MRISKAEHDKAYYNRNRQKKLEYVKKYQVKHKKELSEAKRQYSARWAERNKDSAGTRYRECKAGAKRRGKEFTLTLEEFLTCFNKPCHYCKEPNSLGVDRVNSSIGYTIENIVPCCGPCNKAKLQMTPEQYIAHCKKVVQANL